MNQFPNFQQVCLLFDREAPLDLEALVARFLVEERPVSYNRVIDTKPGAFYRLFGQNQVMVTIEYVAQRVDVSKFEIPLTAPLHGPLGADLRARIAAHRTAVLVNVHHGSLPPQGEIGALLRQLNVQVGANLGAFKQRLRIAARLGALACEMGRPSLVHWTPTDHLLREDAFRTLAAAPIPSLLHIQPLAFGAGEDEQGSALAGVNIFGGAHFLGRDIRIAPSRIPWIETLDAALAFLKLATIENGYVIPDGDTFSPQDGSATFRVRHLREGPRYDGTQGPIYELQPLDFPAHGFRSPDFIPPRFSFDGGGPPPPEVKARLGQTGATVAQQWREKQRMAAAAGNELRVKYDPGQLRPVQPTVLRRLLRVVTGRRSDLPGGPASR
jgi:hypothetical protein